MRRFLSALMFFLGLAPLALAQQQSAGATIPPWVTVLVGAIAAVAGAVGAGLANAFAAKQRVKETRAESEKARALHHPRTANALCRHRLNAKPDPQPSATHSASNMPETAQDSLHPSGRRG